MTIDARVPAAWGCSQWRGEADEGAELPEDLGQNERNIAQRGRGVAWKGRGQGRDLGQVLQFEVLFSRDADCQLGRGGGSKIVLFSVSYYVNDPLKVKR